MYKDSFRILTFLLAGAEHDVRTFFQSARHVFMSVPKAPKEVQISKLGGEIPLKS
ncbi:hypothetical protein [Cytobacillus gottheilii]|uniref:hypothetical protein n=1 Tax=Cytobacillus gottheilii TaxID=859144 RepID=UPI000AE9FE9C|nr:hypothetical protein [Cytobacillus gottheilii]